MRFPTFRRSWAFTLATLVLLACLAQAALSRSAAEPNLGADILHKQGMTPTKKAEALGKQRTKGGFTAAHEAGEHDAADIVAAAGCRRRPAAGDEQTRHGGQAVTP